MLTSPKTLEKLRRLEATYQDLVYEPVETLSCVYAETDAHLRAVPGDEMAWRPCPSGTEWGRAWGSAWFKAEFRVPAALAAQPVYLMARTGAVEALYWLDGRPTGLFNYDPFVKIRGDHRAQRVTASADPTHTYRVALEGYAGHPTPGSQPFQTVANQDVYPAPFVRTFDHLALCRRHQDVLDFVLDLRALNQLAAALPAESFRRGAVEAALGRVFEVVTQDPEQAEPAAWRAGLASARTIMQPVLACRNGDSAPFAGLTGHSHMDTAWHWTLEETIRKCARTYANALHLMEQYPEYRFIQSSAYHAELMRRHYPAIFDGIRRRVAEGRWEPNGGGWIEPDVNLSGGESLIRQFLAGQRFTREQFGYTSDTFWLPDSFGYSAALPQILRGCGLRYFLTTKLTWNESNTFPYDTFWWEGIDGSRVFTHFNDIHCAPDPETLINKLHGTGPRDFRVVQNCVRHTDVTDRRLISYGYGDGGGGPDAQMIEMARRCRDLEGCPRAEHVSVSAFMTDLEARAAQAPRHVGELYLEGHRGTLTQLHEIKRRNRQAEFALREAEFLAVLARGRVAPPLSDLWSTLLINQFHDILPGTSIAEVHDRAIRELGEVVTGAQSAARASASSLVQAAPDRVTLFNSLGWTRNEAVVEDVPAGAVLAGDGVTSQRVTTPWGASRVVVQGVNLPALGWRSFSVAQPGVKPDPVPFAWQGDILQTPLLLVHFADGGGLDSVVDQASGRELRAPEGLALNTFLFGEDVPAAWDNWDIDADLAMKLKPTLRLIQREVVAQGPLQCRVRQTFAFGQGSRLVQDVVLHAHTARIDFETVMHWQEKHAFLAVTFPLNLRATVARHETQFGHVERPTHRNTSVDRARFEVCQHKWTDLSENRWGVALLNDGKYGVSVDGATLRLSLHKGGCHPDPRGDAGEHVCTYSLLPHTGAFSAETVVRPAYEVNVQVTAVPGQAAGQGASLFTVDVPNVVVEAVKPAEDGRGYIVRLYECERSATRARVRFADASVTIEETNLLEENLRPIPAATGVVDLVFRALEIKTLRVVPAS